MNGALLGSARPADLAVLGGHAGGQVRPIAAVSEALEHHVVTAHIHSRAHSVGVHVEEGGRASRLSVLVVPVVVVGREEYRPLVALHLGFYAQLGVVLVVHAALRVHAEVVIDAIVGVERDGLPGEVILHPFALVARARGIRVRIDCDGTGVDIRSQHAYGGSAFGLLWALRSRRPTTECQE